jgi:hypothetical protein
MIFSDGYICGVTISIDPYKADRLRGREKKERRIEV